MPIISNTTYKTSFVLQMINTWIHSKAHPVKEAPSFFRAEPFIHFINRHQSRRRSCSITSPYFRLPSFHRVPTEFQSSNPGLLAICSLDINPTFYRPFWWRHAPYVYSRGTGNALQLFVSNKRLGHAVKVVGVLLSFSDTTDKTLFRCWSPTWMMALSKYVCAGSD